MALSIFMQVALSVSGIESTTHEAHEATPWHYVKALALNPPILSESKLNATLSLARKCQSTIPNDPNLILYWYRFEQLILAVQLQQSLLTLKQSQATNALKSTLVRCQSMAPLLKDARPFDGAVVSCFEATVNAAMSKLTSACDAESDRRRAQTVPLILLKEFGRANRIGQARIDQLLWVMPLVRSSGLLSSGELSADGRESAAIDEFIYLLLRLAEREAENEASDLHIREDELLLLSLHSEIAELVVEQADEAAEQVGAIAQSVLASAEKLEGLLNGDLSKYAQRMTLFIDCQLAVAIARVQVARSAPKFHDSARAMLVKQGVGLAEQRKQFNEQQFRGLRDREFHVEADEVTELELVESLIAGWMLSTGTTD